MSTLQIVLIAVAAAIIVAFLIFTLFVSRMRKGAVEEVKRRLGEDDIVLIEERANCFGVESRGHGYLQTFGCLAVTPDRLLYVQWSPKEELEISRVDILDVDQTTEHLGSDRGTELLSVRYRDSNVEADEESGRPGGEDRVAWKVDRLPLWHNELLRD